MSSFGYNVLGFGSFPNRNVPAEVEYLVIAGGGGGGRRRGGGGGAGGYLTSTTLIAAGEEITITVGSGGNGAPASSGSATNGSNSSIGSYAVATGGGAGVAIMRLYLAGLVVVGNLSALLQELQALQVRAIQVQMLLMVHILVGVVVQMRLVLRITGAMV